MDDDFDVDEEHNEAFAETGFWGRQGAGCVVFALATGRMLVAKRSEEVLEPHTWGTWGGAIDDTEDPRLAMLRELEEETALDPSRVIRVIDSFVFESKDSAFRYHNFIAVVQDEFLPELNWESEDSAWVTPDALPADLHPGLQALMDSQIARQQLVALKEETRQCNSLAATTESSAAPNSRAKRPKKSWGEPGMEP